MRSRSASPRNFKLQAWANLRVDPRSPLEKRIAELELRGEIGRTRPQWAGTRTPEIMRQLIAACEDEGESQ